MRTRAQANRIRDQKVILVISDIHLGRSLQKDVELVDHLIDCARSYGANLKELILLGDVFDAYMEYPKVTDSRVTLLRPLLEELQFRNVIVTYHVGNHDPWHLTFFQSEFGITVLHAPTQRTINRRNYYLSHGDKEANRGLVVRISRHFMRSPIYYLLYRKVLPAQMGQELPRFVSRKYASLHANNDTIRKLQKAASQILLSDEIDIVIMGHCHEQSKEAFFGGHYYNSGSWYVDLSYLEIRPNTVVLKKWKQIQPEMIQKS